MIGQIENAILARIKAASDAEVLGYKIRELDSLPIDVDERLRERVIDFPAAWTAFGGWRPVQILGDDSAEVEATIHVMVAAQNARNERATRFGGSAKEVGSYQMAEDVTALLSAQSLGLPISALKLGACQPLYSGALKDDRTVSILSVSWTTKFIVAASAAGDAPEAGQFVTWHADWDVPPFGDLAQPLPTGDADASDTLILDQEAP